MARPRMLRIPRPSHWRQMMAPVRFELIESMRALAPCSAREIAVSLDRPADSLYPHLRVLLRIGVVRDVGERPGRTRPERVYDLAADDFRPGFKGADRAVTAQVVDRSMQTMTRIVAKTSRAAASAGRIAYEHDDQNVVGKIEHAWLSPAEFAHVRTRLRSLKRYLDSRRTRREGELYMAAFFLLPVARSRGARLAVTDHAARPRTKRS